MESRIEKNIVKEILIECHQRKLYPNEQFITYFVHLLLLNPNWGIIKDLLISRANVQELVEYVISQLQDNTQLVRTLKMQFIFMWNMDNLNHFLTKTRVTLLKRIKPFKDKICATKMPVNEDEMNTFKRLIVFYVVFSSGLGNPLIEEVFLEGLIALRSVMDDEELKEFCTYSKEQKVLQIEELSKIICGIRLFNKYTGKGGAGILDLVELYTTAVDAVKEEMKVILFKVVEKVDLLTKMFEKFYYMRKQNDLFHMEITLPDSVNTNFIEQSKDELIHYRQYELFIRKIMRQIEISNEQVKRINEEFHTTVENVGNTVASRLAVPVTIIFPLFNQLSNLWTALQNQIELLCRYNKLARELESVAPSKNNNVLEELISGTQTPIKRKFIETVKDVFLKKTAQVNIVQLEDHMDLQYLGFCCWKLVETNGVLIPGNPTMGVATTHNMYFAFSSLEAYGSFKMRPDHYIKSVLHMARRKPQLIHFLLLEKQLSTVSNIKKLVKETTMVKQTESVGTQMVAEHIPSPEEETSIKWNLWDHKRDLLLQCSIKNSKTVHVQTWKTFCTNNIEVETIERKDQESQTPVDKTTSTRNHSSYIIGLRGRRDT